MVWTPKVELIKKTKIIKNKDIDYIVLVQQRKGVHIFMWKNNTYTPEFKIKLITIYRIL